MPQKQHFEGRGFKLRNETKCKKKNNRISNVEARRHSQAMEEMNDQSTYRYSKDKNDKRLSGAS